MRAKPRANGSHGDMRRFIARETEHARADATECDTAEPLARRRIQAGRIAPGKLVAVPAARPLSRNGADPRAPIVRRPGLPAVLPQWGQPYESRAARASCTHASPCLLTSNRARLRHSP